MKRRVFVNDTGWSQRAAMRLRKALPSGVQPHPHLAFCLTGQYGRLTHKLRDYPDHKSIKGLLDICFNVCCDVAHATGQIAPHTINSITEIGYYLGANDMRKAVPLIISAAKEFPEGFSLIIGGMRECTNINGDYENFKRHLDSSLEFKRKLISLTGQSTLAPSVP